jgi:hypothetical protein
MVEPLQLPCDAVLAGQRAVDGSGSVKRTPSATSASAAPGRGACDPMPVRRVTSVPAAA